MKANRTKSQIGKSNVRRGKSHERQVAKMLTEWSGVKFRRRRVEGKDTDVIAVESVSDVIPCDGDFLFNIEAKCGSGFSFDALMANPRKSLFTNWWCQATYDSNLFNSVRKSKNIDFECYPMLFFRPMANANWVAISYDVMDKLGHFYKSINHLIFHGFDNYNPIEYNVSHSTKNKVIEKINLPSIIFCRWCDFAANVDPMVTFWDKNNGMRLQ